MSDSAIDPDTMRRAAMQKLRGWRMAGLTHLPRPPADEPVDAPAPAVEAAADSHSPPQRAAPATAKAPPSAEPTAPETLAPALSTPLPLAERQQRLAALAERVAGCTRCQELAATRTQTVFGVGNAEARVMFIGEAPGADEDQQGEPFVGKAGQLLNRIIAACGWRREDIYICNILRCRPPGNRNPTDEEAANCREWLDGQIAIVRPEYIVCWGSVAAKNLLGTDQAIGRLRGQWFEHAGAQVLCTYHPSYLLRNPAAKKPVWDDMKLLLAAMGLSPPSGPG